MKIKMPTQLIAYSFYQEGEGFCAMGYIAKELFGAVPEEWSGITIPGYEGSWPGDFLIEKFGKKNYDTVTRANNRAKTDEERLAAFRSSCELLGIEIYE